MRVVVIGAGSIAYRHAAACRDPDDAELVAVCDVRRAAADALADRFGVPARYSDLDALLDNGPADVAIVATWGAFRAEVVERLSRSGRVRAILCEKPLAMDDGEAEAMFKVAANSGVLLAEAFRLRNQPIHHRAIELIRSGHIDDVVHVRNAMMWTLPPEDKNPARNWRFDKAVGRWGPTGVDEHVTALATFAEGRTPEWCVSWQAGPAHVAEVLGTAGSIRIRLDPHSERCGDGANTATVLEIVDTGRNREVEQFAPTDQFWLQLQHMQDCLDQGTPHRILGADSIAQMRVIDAVHASLGSGLPARV
jgi:predicted dehydrogenase